MRLWLRKRRLRVLHDLQNVLNRIPVGFQDDGCSMAPDRLFSANLRPACRAHDWLYCTRAHPAGALDQAWRTRADHLLGRAIRALLPLGVGWVGWLYWQAVRRYGGVAAFDSCGPAAKERCRHNMPRPEWM